MALLRQTQTVVDKACATVPKSVLRLQHMHHEERDLAISGRYWQPAACETEGLCHEPAGVAGPLTDEQHADPHAVSTAVACQLGIG